MPPTPPRTGPRLRTLLARHERALRRVDPPAPGEAVLACRCGQVLGLADLHRPAAAPGPRSGPSIEPIRCRRCAGVR